jgi:hypothetical protein
MKILVNEDLSQDFVSSAVNIEDYLGFSVHGVLAGANPNGSFIIQASNEEVTEGSKIVHWSDLPDTEIAVDSAGDLMSNNGAAFYTWFRVKWTAGTGSVGTLNAFISCKR